MSASVRIIMIITNILNMTCMIAIATVFKMFPPLRKKKTLKVKISSKNEKQISDVFIEGLSEGCRAFHLEMGYKSKRKK